MLTRANIIVYNYQYMLDPKVNISLAMTTAFINNNDSYHCQVSNLVSRELEQESIVVFDEVNYMN